MSTPRTGRKISQLPTLETASLDVYVVGISGDTTYKLSLDALEDAVINTLSASLDNRVDFLETFSSSYNQFSSSVNAQLNANSASALEFRLDALEAKTGSYATTGSNSFTGAITASYFKGDGSALTNVTGALSVTLLDEGVYKGGVTTFNFSGSNVVSSVIGGVALVEVKTDNTLLSTSSFNSFSASVNNRIIAATNEQSFNGLISGSSQLTASYDERYALSGSLATTGSNVFKGQQIISGALTVSISGNAFGVNENPTPNNIFWSYIPNDTNTTSIESGWVVNVETVGIYTVTNVEYDYPFVKITLSDALLQLPYRCNGYFSLPSSELKFGTDGVLKISGSLSVSGSITGSTNFNTIVNKPTLISGSSQLTSSLDTRYAASGSAPTLFLLEAYANETYTLPGGFTEDPCRYSVVSVNENVPSNWFNTSTYRFTPQKAGYWEINACYDVYRNSEASMAIRKNGSIVASAGSFNAVAQQVIKIVYLNGSTDYIDIVNTGGGTLQRYQYQQRSWFQAKWIGQ